MASARTSTVIAGQMFSPKRRYNKSSDEFRTLAKLSGSVKKKRAPLQCRVTRRGTTILLFIYLINYLFMYLFTYVYVCMYVAICF